MKLPPRTKRTLRNVLAGLLLAAPVLGANPAGAGVLVQYNFNSTTTPLAASTVGSGITSASSIGFGSPSWFWSEPSGAGALQLNAGFVNTAAQAVSSNMYFSFTISSATPMNLSSLTLDGAYGNFSSPGGYVLESSADGYASVISTANFTTQLPTFATYTIDLTGASFQGLTSITFRICGYNAIYGFEQFDNLTVNGSLGVPVSAANTTISANPASITADGASTSTLTVQARDANNNNVAASGGVVTLSATAGSLSAVTDNGNGTYTATLTSSTTARTANITGTIGGATIGHPTSVTFTPGPVSAANTTISANPASIAADGASTSTLTVQAKDANNNILTSSGGTVTLNASTGSLSGVTDNLDGTYTATLTSSTTPGTANITGTIGGTAIGHPASVIFIGPMNAANTTIIANPASIIANGTSTSTLTVQAKDANNNNLTSSGGTVTLSTTAGTLSGVTDNGNGTYTATLTSPTTPGTASITGTIGGATIGHPTSVTLQERVSAANTTISANPTSIIADGTSTSTLTVQVKDANTNNLTSSGGTVMLNTTAGTLSAVTDNLDGTYTATLTSSTMPGTASITGMIGGNAIGHWTLVTFTAMPGTLQLTKIEFVPTGTHIVWNASQGQSYSVLASSNLVNWNTTLVGVAGDFIDTSSRAGVPQMFYRVRQEAQPTNPPPDDIVALVPAGAFTMGDASDGESDAMPTTSVNVSAFYMDTNLVSYSLWQSVYNWATSAGYSFVNAGAGKAANHPVQAVDWFDVVKWCNARSQQAGKTPVYYTDAGLTQVYTNAEVPVYVNWSASGYRLPTEAEWEKAARGALNGKRFSWGDTISESQANYYGATASYSYDSGPNGYNSIGSIGGVPGTSPVGSFAPNGYGLYDMTGNVFEWCWDWYGTPYAGGSDPHGPASGCMRVVRGGLWNGYAYGSRCALRYVDVPFSANTYFGFRCVRGL